MRKYCLIILLCFVQQAVFAAFDTCTLKASFYPSRDTLVTTSFNTVFNNTTVGATDLTWYSNGVAYSLASQFNYSTTTIGVNEVLLAVKNGFCIDTARMYVVVTGTPPSTHDYYKLGLDADGKESIAYSVARINSEEYVMGGYNNYFIGTGFRKKAFLTMLSDDGCIRWSKQIADTTDHNVTQLKKAANGDILVGYDSHTIMRMDANGNPKWTKILPDYLTVKRIFTDFMEDADGNILIFYSGYFVGVPNQSIVKIDGNGNTIWARSYYVPDTLISQLFGPTYKQTLLPHGIVQANGSYYFSGQLDTRLNYLGQTLNQSFLSRIDVNTGATQWTKLYTGTGPFSIGALYVYNNQLLASVGEHGTAKTVYFDMDGNFQKMYVLNMVLDPSIAFTRYFFDFASIVPLASGDILWFARTGVAFHDSILYHGNNSFLRIHNGNQIVWEKNQLTPINGNDFINWYLSTIEGKNESLVAAGYIAPNASENKAAALMKIAANGDKTTGCYEGPLLTHAITTDLITTEPMSWTSENAFSSPTIDQHLTLENISMQRKWFCPFTVDSCSLLKIKGPYTICDLGKDYTYRIHKSGTCTNTIRVSDGVHIKIVTDSSLVVSFTQGGRQTIKLSMTGTCVPLEDSINITVTAGSIDLIPNAIICASDSVVFKLPVGFSGFDISPRLNIASSTASQIVAKPVTTTTYTLSLFKSAGCGLLDTALITVYPVTPIYFGNDTSLCKGQSLTLNAANTAYTGYQWSTGSTASQITVKDKGSYWVHAKDKYGCINADTIAIKKYKRIASYFAYFRLNTL